MCDPPTCPACLRRQVATRLPAEVPARAGSVWYRGADQVNPLHLLLKILAYNSELHTLPLLYHLDGVISVRKKLPHETAEYRRLLADEKRR